MCAFVRTGGDVYLTWHKKERWTMNVVRCFIVLGLVGLLTGCVTRVDTGYVEPYVPALSTSTYSSSPVYDASPVYYASPVSGYSTTTIYDGGFPVYMDTHYPYYSHRHYSHRHHRPPPPPPRFEHRPQHHVGNGGHGRRIYSGGRIQPPNRKSAPVSRVQPPNRKPTPSRTPPRRGPAPTRGRRR